MLIQSQAGSLPNARQAAGTPNNPGGTFGEALMSEINPTYYSLLKAGKVFSLASANITSITAFTGGAAGTPIFGMYNPPSSGVDLVLLQARLGIRNSGTTVVNTGFDFWAVNQGSTAVTGTQTVARNLYSLAQSGSASYCMVNTANTAALASNFIAPSVSIGAAVTTTAAISTGMFNEDLHGAIAVPPGGYLAWGCYVTTATVFLDAALIWAEIPA